MPPKRLIIPAEKVAEGRFLYEQTMMALEDVAAAMGISRATLSKRLKEWGWKKRNYGSLACHRAKGAQPAQAPDKVFRAYPRDADRIAIIERLQKAVDQQLAVVEAIASAGQTKSEAERTTRMFASLSCILREMARLDAPPPAPAESADDTAVPHDLDELRRELSRRLAALMAEQSSEAAGGA